MAGLVYRPSSRTRASPVCSAMRSERARSGSTVPRRTTAAATASIADSNTATDPPPAGGPGSDSRPSCAVRQSATSRRSRSAGGPSSLAGRSGAAGSRSATRNVTVPAGRIDLRSLGRGGAGSVAMAWPVSQARPDIDQMADVIG
jgi:hypothetical protein